MVVSSPASDIDGSAMTLQQDGKLLIVSNVTVLGNGLDFYVTRHNTDGSLDTTFDGDGIATTNVVGIQDYARAIAVQPDGRIVVAGNTRITSSNTDVAVVRYNTDGSLDTTFDGDGKVTTDFGGSFDTGYAMALQNDGKILVTGTRTMGGKDLLVVRYNTDGSLDTTFDGDGKVTTDIADDSGRAIAIQQDGRILVGGRADAGGAIDFILVRYNSDGSLDTTFDGDGKVTADISGSDLGRAISLLPDGRILLAGDSASDMSIARFNTDGSLDTTFDGDGKVTTDVNSSTDNGHSVTVQQDGKVLVSGYSSTSAGTDASLLRYHADGTLDSTFDGDGKVITDISNDVDTFSGLALQTNGKIVVSGVFSDLTTGYSGIIRYNAAPLSATLAATSPTSNLGSVTFTVTGTGTVDCTTLSKTAGVDFDMTGIAAVTEIAQTSSSVCTITATSTATAGGSAVTASLTAAPTFSIGFTNGNTRKSINGSPQSVSVTVPAPTTTTTTTTTIAATSTIPATTTTVAVRPRRAAINSLPLASPRLVADSTLAAGESVTVSVGRLTPGGFAQLVVASAPRVIAKGYVNANGTVTLSGTLPASLGNGKHTLAVYEPGTGKGFRQPITVTTPDTLPATGSNTGVEFLLFGLMLAAFGSAITAIRQFISR